MDIRGDGEEAVWGKDQQVQRPWRQKELVCSLQLHTWGHPSNTPFYTWAKNSTGRCSNSTREQHISGLSTPGFLQHVITAYHQDERKLTNELHT